MKEWSKKDWRDILTSTLRVIFWAIFIEVVLHYFYFNSIMLHLRLMWHIPLWALAGIGYGAGQFFMVKVYVYYQCITPHGTTVFSLHPISIPQAILRFGLRHTQNLLGWQDPHTLVRAQSALKKGKRRTNSFFMQKKIFSRSKSSCVPFFH